MDPQRFRKMQSNQACLVLFLPNGERVTMKGTRRGDQDIPMVSGEVVFQTGMVGYVESLTDPSYAGQILVLTYPLIGNYGVPDQCILDDYGIPLHVESSKIAPKALVVSEMAATPSHHLSATSLDRWLRDHRVIGITGIDTRKLTLLVREHGTLPGVICSGDWIPTEPPSIDPPHPRDVVTQQVRTYGSSKDEATIHVMVIDCGMKNNQLRMLLGAGDAVRVTVVPYSDDFEPRFTLLECTHLFISNGPGDPHDCSELRLRLWGFMNRSPSIPVMGICLGHQILALAAGCTVRKMKYGNRGHNIPCKLVGTTRTFITSQNHGFEVIPKPKSRWKPLFVNLNDGSNEGLVCTEPGTRRFSVQFHPEAKAGPEDTSRLFDLFINGRDPITRETFEEFFQVPPRSPVPERKKVLILGSGGLKIGQAGEFDYSGGQAMKSLAEEDLTIVLHNPNIATVQTTSDFLDTIETTQHAADLKIYLLPVTPQYVEETIALERPDCIALSFGGQTALNCGAELYRSGVLQKYGVEVLGTPVESILLTEDRDAFKRHIQSIGERIPDGVVASTKAEAIEAAERIGYPVLVRAAYTLGGLGSGFADNRAELERHLTVAFSSSPQVIIDKSLRGWKEVEYEIVRDRYGNIISVCNMENLDPLGVHTGESCVVAPCQTLTDEESMMLRRVAFKTVSSLNIVGECNIQYALDPHSNDYFIIEINARLSRSSALASKATGYPLAYVAAKLCLGASLDELKNSITGTTSACFEPSLDYCVVKLPRWDLLKFDKVDSNIGSAMKSVGEGMAISRHFEQALQSAIRMTRLDRYGLRGGVIECTDEILHNPTYQRILAVADGLWSGRYSVEQINQLSGIDRWFLDKIHGIVITQRLLEQCRGDLPSPKIIKQAKLYGFSDEAIAFHCQVTEMAVRAARLEKGILPSVKKIDTVAGEYPCDTNYLYLTYDIDRTVEEVTPLGDEAVMVIGSGVYSIGSSVEFDCCSVSCSRRLRQNGTKVVMVNCNPETVSTDYDEADALYFVEISFETVMDIYQLEHPRGVIVSVGGQAPNNIALDLSTQEVRVIGTDPANIDRAENRYKFSRMLDHIGIDQPQWRELTSIEDALEFCEQTIGWPCLVRPSYVLSGAAMNVAFNAEQLREFLGTATEVSPDHPVVVSKFISDAKEIEVDAVAAAGELKLLAISEHIENAGVHSGDATIVFPAQDLTDSTVTKISNATRAIAEALHINGPFNIQFIAKDDEVKVIECNLRVSRSLPFVSKTMGIDMVACATDVMMGRPIDWASKTPKHDVVAVKTPQFSYNRLPGAEILSGVEMRSTGEVACFGANVWEAFLKSSIAAGFRLPEPGSNVLVSIGGFAFKREFQHSITVLKQLGFRLYGTRNTASFYDVEEMRMRSDDTDETILDWIHEKWFSLVINITERNKLRCERDPITDGYLLRRSAIDSGIPIVTDIKVAKMMTEALRRASADGYRLPVHPSIDRITKYTLIQIPGLIDVHVHVREPGETHKETWETCTKAALAGGITVIGAMPNTTPPLCSREDWNTVENLASSSALCDYMLYAGASKQNVRSVSRLAPAVAGLKMYLNSTHGPLVIADDVMVWWEHLKHWTHPNHPVCVHAEGATLAAVLQIAAVEKRRIHVCHVSNRAEIMLIAAAKRAGQNVTCEVAPHHLFMACDDIPEDVRAVKPPLGCADDCEALWEHLDIIDCFATDHAPHTLEDKREHGCPGYPGLQEALPLLLTAVNEGRLTLEDIIDRYHRNPARIFNIPPQSDTYVVIDMGCTYRIESKALVSKAGWSPWEGRVVKGAVKRVVMRGEVVMIHDRPDVQPTFPMTVQGKNLRSNLIAAAAPESEIVNVFQSVESPLRKPVLNGGDWSGVSVLSVETLTKPMLRELFSLADEMRSGTYRETLAGKTIGLLFYENSTRTRVSFESAMKQLGGYVIHVHSEHSSVKKGESLLDTARCMEASANIDALVLRHSERGSAQAVAKHLSVPLINAGDGDGEHPTQTLLDLYTIRQELGTVGGLCVTMVGDLRHGRTVHSLAKALALRPNVRLHYVSPPELQMPADVMQYVERAGVEQFQHDRLTDDIIAVSDVLYVTRLQRERLREPIDEKEIIARYQITPSVLAKAKPPRQMCILHPLPRGEEISPLIDSDPRAAYHRQMENGHWIRKALLTLVLRDLNN